MELRWLFSERLKAGEKRFDRGPELPWESRYQCSGSKPNRRLSIARHASAYPGDQPRRTRAEPSWAPITPSALVWEMRLMQQRHPGRYKPTDQRSEEPAD